MRLINLHAVLIALVVSAQVAASFIPTEERGTSFSCEIFLRSSFLPNYLRSQPAIAAESGSEEGFLPDVKSRGITGLSVESVMAVGVL
ncbi:hypothetical protein V8E53_013036 [Lactarius tabidus]